LEESKKMGLDLPGLRLANELYENVQRRGDGQLGTHALQKSLAITSGIDWESR
jgi:3-hydroxyisobutyrate dehydrogenase-like beta-hydroxyacid dehydrogenase